MSVLNTRDNFADHDEVYEQIVQLFDGRSEYESLKAIAKVVLLLANHIGDPLVVNEAIAIARTSDVQDNSVPSL